MNCRKVNHLLSAYMDGELPGVEHRQIHEHLARCSECADEYVGLLRMKRLLAGMGVREPRTDLATRIVEQAHRTHDARHLGPAVRWTELVNVWWKTAAPSTPALALGAGFAIMGVIAVSKVVDPREPIHWRSPSPLALASYQPAPDVPLTPQDSDPVHIEGAVSNVGFSPSDSRQQRNNAFAPQAGDLNDQIGMFLHGSPPHVSMLR